MEINVQLIINLWILMKNIKYMYNYFWYLVLTRLINYIGNFYIRIICLGHTDVVTINDALRLVNQTLYIITAAGDCTAKFWIKSKNESKFLLFT